MPECTAAVVVRAHHDQLIRVPVTGKSAGWASVGTMNRGIYSKRAFGLPNDIWVEAVIVLMELTLGSSFPLHGGYPSLISVCWAADAKELDTLDPVCGQLAACSEAVPCLPSRLSILCCEMPHILLDLLWVDVLDDCVK